MKQDYYSKGVTVSRSMQILLVLLLVSRSTLSVAEGPWLTDLDAGRRAAREQNKDLLILFTGTSWCFACDQLEYEVLVRSEFELVADELVLVKLEFPSSNEELPAEVKAKYIAWRGEFGVTGFPTAFLADASGRPYAVTGCTGETAKDYVARLQGLQSSRQRRDAALTNSASATGLEAARYTDRALEAILPGFDPDFTTAEGSYLLWFYGPEIERILAADSDGAAGLRTKYQTLFDDQKERKQIKALLEQIKAIRRERGEDAAIELIRRELDQTDSKLRAAQLRTSLVGHLDSAERYSQALETALQFALVPQLEADKRRWFKSRAAHFLTRLERPEEALAMYDAAIAEVGESHPRAFLALQDQAELLTRLGRLDDAEATWQRARRCVKPGTLNWREAQIFHGRLLSKRGRHAEAIAVLTGLLAETDVGDLDRALALGELAVAQGLAGQTAQADAWAAETAALLEGLTSPEDASTVDFIRGRLRLARGETAEK